MQFVMFTKHLTGLSLEELIATLADVGVAGADLAVRPGYPVNPDNMAAELPRAARTVPRRRPGDPPGHRPDQPHGSRQPRGRGVLRGLRRRRRRPSQARLLGLGPGAALLGPGRRDPRVAGHLSGVVAPLRGEDGGAQPLRHHPGHEFVADDAPGAGVRPGARGSVRRPRPPGGVRRADRHGAGDGARLPGLRGVQGPAAGGAAGGRLVGTGRPDAHLHGAAGPRLRRLPRRPGARCAASASPAP